MVKDAVSNRNVHYIGLEGYLESDAVLFNDKEISKIRSFAQTLRLWLQIVMKDKANTDIKKLTTLSRRKNNKNTI